jgi:small-conductance mechanosensitive channel
MELIKTWAIPSGALIIWLGLVFSLVPIAMRYLRAKAQRSKITLDDLLVNALEMPLILFFVAIGFKVFFDAVPLSPKVAKYGTALLILLFILAGYIFLDKIFIEGLSRYSKKIQFIATSAGALKSLIRIVILGLVILIILDRLNITITPFLASMGIGGLVIALALQDTLANFFAGLHIFGTRPISVGNYVKLESGEEGYVSHIGWRNTRIRMLPNNTIIIPNSRVVNSQIINFYRPQKEMAALVQVGVSYDSDLDHVERVTVEVAREVLRDTPGGVSEFEPFIRYHTFDDFSINFTVILRVKEYVDKYLVTHEFVKRLHKGYKEEGIEIPFPIRTLQFRGKPHLTTEPDREGL